VPNVSEGRDPVVLEAIGSAFDSAGARLLDIHSDPDHHRGVLTLAGSPGHLAPALLAGSAVAIERIEVGTTSREPTTSSQEPPPGLHPHVGAIDVIPIVYLREADRGAACAEALVTADIVAERLDLPVFLYGVLAGGRTRAEIRRGGYAGLAERMSSGQAEPDFGPRRMHPTAGAALVAARPPLVAFNLELAPPATGKTARRIAAAIREGGTEGLEGVRAIGLELPSREGLAEVSVNVEDPAATPLARVVAAVRRHASVQAGELVGLAPRAALEGFPEDVPLPGFDPQRHLTENALGL
jgi:glutamate formiminotransferase/glutamate formiminotransferase/formiminotetrahydrofolate cyclodeaminase